MGNIQEKSWKEKIKTDVEFAFANKKNHTPHAYIDIAGDLVAGTLLSQILYWCGENGTGHGKLKIFRDDHYWLVKSREDWYEEVRVNPRQYDTAISKLKGEIKEKGKVARIDESKQFVEVKVFKFNGVPTTHIRPIYENINRAIDEWKNALAQSMNANVFGEKKSDEISISQKCDLENLQNGEKEMTDSQDVIYNHNNIDIDTEITNKDYNINSKANSFFAKKVRENKKVVKQNDFINSIHNVVKQLKEEVFDEDQADNLEQFFIYFIERYAQVFGKKHPFLKEETLYRVAADLTEHIYLDRGEFYTNFVPLVSDKPEDNSYESVVDLYFETEFKENIDYSMVHFCQQNILTKLMGRDTSHSWFTNKS